LTALTATIRDRAIGAPDAPALILPDGEILSNAGLDRAIDRIAARVMRLGIAQGQTVVAPRVRVSPAADALALILGLSMARIGVTVADTVSAAPGHLVLLPTGVQAPANIGKVAFHDPSWLEDDGTTAHLPVTPHDPAAVLRIISTSGTSGTPRQCIVTHGMMGTRIETDHFPATGPNGRPVLLCAMGGTSSLRSFFITMGKGGTMVLPPEGDRFQAIVRHGVTALFCGPAWLRQTIAEAPQSARRPPSLEAIVVSGSALPAPLAEKAARVLCPNIMVLYGATETGTIALGPYGPALDTPLGRGVGVVKPGVEVQALDESGAPLPPGEEGPLRIRTPGMIAGYLGATPAAGTGFRDGWFHPGDVGLVTKDRVLVLSGRVTEIINTGGLKISPRRIEDALLAYPGISQAAAFGVEDDDGLPVIWAAIVTDKPLDGPAFNQFCQARLGGAAPRAILQMPDLPRNENGKVLVSRLAELARGRKAA
jgi:acyl-coenzyme A synthetase/AMP-(fatty) acid ligase